MKCPKCGYLGYERVERCRNCGYEFALGSSTPTPPPDLRLRDTRHTPQPLDDLTLIDAATPPPPSARFSDLMSEASQPGASGDSLDELPLFGAAPITGDEPLVKMSPTPRPVLSVRRSTEEAPRVRSEMRAPLLDWTESTSTPTPSSRVIPDREPTPQPERIVRARPSTVEDAEPAQAAEFGPRALATLIDLALLAAVDFIVVYFTMKICRLTLAEVTLLPKAPLLAFLLLQNGGYFIAFTTTGQTLGKLFTGVRVQENESDSAPDIGRSTLRALLWMVLALPVGLGLLTALLSRDGRGLHDRFAGTRVVRAGA